MAPRILVIYGTTDGQTRKVAVAIADTLRAEGADVDLVDSAFEPGPPAHLFAGVVVAASVHAGGYQRSVRDWVAAHADALGRRPNAFVSVCLGVLEHNPATDRALAGIVDKFAAATGWQPAERRVVAGALKYRRYNWIKRWTMKRIVAKAGGDTDTSRDYEYTDWDDVRAFARAFARRCLTPQATAALS